MIGFINTKFIKELVFDIDERTIGNEYAYLVNDPGEVVVTADKEVEILSPHPDLGIGNMKQKLEGDETGYLVYVNSKGRKVISAYADLSEYGTEGIGDWSLLSTAPYKDVMEPVYNLLYKMAAIFILIFTCSFLTIIIFTTALTKSITILNDATMSIGKGNFDIKVQIDSRDEIGILAKAFNQMTGSLNKITCDQKQAEEKIKSSLKEKETLLQEIHHRVKNNLTVVSSLLSLQGNSAQDERIKEALNESQGRIHAMSAVHESLYSSENLADIDLKPYLSKISGTLIQTYSLDSGKVRFNIEGDKILLNIEKASPVGLIINELISNSLKYAFPEDKLGEISINMKNQDKELQLTVKDDGVGMPKDFDWKNSSSLGLKLVRTLVENQLDGSIDLDNLNGTKFTIKFNIET